MKIPRLLPNRNHLQTSAPDACKDAKPKSKTFNSLILIFKVGAYSLLGSYFFTQSPNVDRGLQYIERKRGRLPTPTNITSNPKQDSDHFDGFIRNFKGFSDIENLLGEDKIDLSKTDINRNQILLDNPIEIEKLKEALKAQPGRNAHDLINVLDDISKLSFLIWGYNGPNPNQPFQADLSNCFLMADLKAYSLTMQNSQHLKGIVKVESYSLGAKDFFIDVVVNLNGNPIKVIFSELLKWMNPQGNFSPSQSRDGSLWVPILASALEKETEKYTTFPTFSSTIPPTLISGKDYLSISIYSLSDSDLISILSKAPKVPTKLASFNDPNYTPYNYSPEETTLSEEKAKDYIKSLENRMKATPQKNQQEQKEVIIKRTAKDIVHNHMYVVKSFDPKTKITTITDTYGHVMNVTLQDIREKMIAVVSHNENFPIFDLEAFVKLILGFVLISLATKRLEKCVQAQRA